MATRALAVVALALLVAGCAGSLGTGGSDRGTVTPAAVPEPTPTLAPGVTGERVDPVRLLDSHERALAGPYRFERRVSVADDTGVFRTREVRRVDADGTAVARMRVDVGGPATSPVRNWTRWRDGGHIWSRTTTAVGGRFVHRTAATDTDPFAKGRRLPRQVLTGGRYEVTERPAGGVVLTSAAVSVEEDISVTYVASGPPRNVSARAAVSEAGVVRNLTVSYEARLDGEWVAVRIVQRTDPGPVSVRRPAWVPDGATSNGTARESASRAARTERL